MENQSLIKDPTSWLHSPLSEEARRLRPMSDLFLRPYSGVRKKVKLIKTQLLIGNDPGCDIQILDPFVSPRHAEFILEKGGTYKVRDLDSKNGVYLNGVRVTSAPLPTRGTLRLGRSTLTWTEDGTAEAEMELGWVVADPSMRTLIEGLKNVARTSLPVHLTGETGTGKDVLARMLHSWSANARGPFVPVNGALTGGSLADSELFGHCKGSFTGADVRRLGAFRSAQNGTLFLDEIADVPVSTQVKMLRSLESGEVKPLGSDRAEQVSFRLITATSRDLEKEAEKGRFRMDLYYRIAGYVVHVPPLRERPKDVIAISRKIASEKGMHLCKKAEDLLLLSPWRGNVRELRSSICRAMVNAQSQQEIQIRPEHLEIERGAKIVLDEEATPSTLLEAERNAIIFALKRNAWNRSHASRNLGISRASLYRKMVKFGLQALESDSTTRKRDFG